MLTNDLFYIHDTIFCIKYNTLNPRFDLLHKNGGWRKRISFSVCKVASILIPVFSKINLCLLFWRLNIAKNTFRNSKEYFQFKEYFSNVSNRTNTEKNSPTPPPFFCQRLSLVYRGCSYSCFHSNFKLHYLIIFHYWQLFKDFQAN